MGTDSRFACIRPGRCLDGFCGALDCPTCYAQPYDSVDLEVGDHVTVDGTIYGALVTAYRPAVPKPFARVRYHCPREGPVERWVAVDGLEKE